MHRALGFVQAEEMGAIGSETRTAKIGCATEYERAMDQTWTSTAERRSLPEFTVDSRALTMTMSNFAPARDLMRVSAKSRSIAFWYGRLVVMASRVSATPMMRAINGICGPCSP